MKTYIIKKIDGPITEESFNQANIAKVNFGPFKGTESPFDTELQLLYNDEAIYVHFKTDERPLLARRTDRDSAVCEDSCMEFFLSPDTTDNHYFNFEINPLGTMYLHYNTSRYDIHAVDVPSEAFEIKSVITQTSWELFYKIPFDVILSKFEKITDECRANFYKCGEDTEVEHYACWNEIHLEKPEFHCPDFFGKLIFEKGISVSR